MIDLHDDVALSLLPSWWWRTAAERLRAGQAPREVLERLLVERTSTRPLSASVLLSRAAAALARAAAGGLVPVTWRDPIYPGALATIVDPPFVLWTRRADRLPGGSAVAIVGSRAGAPHAV